MCLRHLLPVVFAFTALTTGCPFHGPEHSVSGTLSVDGNASLVLTGGLGSPVSFESGSLLDLDYRGPHWSGSSSLFVLRYARSPDHGVLLEIPDTVFRDTTDFSASAADIGQSYDISSHMSTEHLGSREYNETIYCETAGYCCKRRGRRAHRHTRCADYDSCPGTKDVLMREDDLVDRYMVTFDPTTGLAAATLNAHGQPYATRSWVRDLSVCRVPAVER